MWKYSFPFNKPVAHCSTNTATADTIGTPIAGGKFKTRLLKIVVAIDKAKLQQKLVRKNSFPFLILIQMNSNNFHKLF